MPRQGKSNISTEISSTAAPNVYSLGLYDYFLLIPTTYLPLSKNYLSVMCTLLLIEAALSPEYV